MKCKVCNGTGFVGIGPGIRGIKKCDVCNGEGEVNAPERIETTNPVRETVT